MNFQISWTERKSFCFCTESSQLSSTLSQWLYLALYWNKDIKHDYYSILIMWTHKNSRYTCWVVSQQALFFNAFLARHDDFNDAHRKDKNWNIMGASWSIWLTHLSLTHFLWIRILWANNLWEQESTSIGRQNKHNFKIFNT